MYSVIGVNDISIKVSEKLGAYLVGPYVSKLAKNHINATLSYLTIPKVIPKNSKIIIDLSFNTITSLIVNDFALSNGKKLISVLNYDGKLLVKNVKKNSCLRCVFEEKNRRYMLNYVIAYLIAGNESKIIDTIESSIREDKDFIIDNVSVVDVSFEKGCESCRNSNFKFLDGEYGEMVNENCGNELSAVFPIDDREINIEYLSNFLELYGIEISDKTDEYINFEVEGKRMFVFKNGRLMISKIGTKEEAEYYFRKYVGS